VNLGMSLSGSGSLMSLFRLARKQPWREPALDMDANKRFSKAHA
jgi:hypothetical protein